MQMSGFQFRNMRSGDLADISKLIYHSTNQYYVSSETGISIWLSDAGETILVAYHETDSRGGNAFGFRLEED
ncbi:MAG: hypothetical protein ACQESR_06910 [Planctomycetota bacterium]